MKTFIKTLSLCIVACILCCCKNKQANNSNMPKDSILKPLLMASVLLIFKTHRQRNLLPGILL